MGRSEKQRLARDAAGVGPHIPQGVRLFPLRELGGWQVADGEPDVRGWEVKTISGREIGTIADLLVDPSRGEVVMLDVDLAGTDRHTLAPIRAVQIDRSRRVVNIDSGDLEQPPSLPRAGASDLEVRDFGDGYARSYGERGWAAEGDYVVGAGPRDLRFARRPGLGSTPRPAEGGTTRVSDREVQVEAASEEGRAINTTMAEVGRVRYPGGRAD